MKETYNPLEIEQQVQNYWEQNQTFKVNEDLDKEKYYCLTMFPYPSGHLHMGHARVYTIGDVISRYQRMTGKNVLQPMGWDAFGLPAENAAIKHQVAPAEWTYKNIESMKVQFKRLGFGYDWSRELATCDPEYYQWEQWLFTRLFEKGLAYKKNSIVNWDPVDQTVLANEQVVNGRGWRSDALVEQREISQWFLKITDYADELLEGLEELPTWPEKVATMQKNWIGRSEGLEVQFSVKQTKTKLAVFTTRPDTLFGVTYLAIAPQHPLAKYAAKDNSEIQDFIESCKNTKVAEADMVNLEKRGIDTGLIAINPLNKKKIPIFIANYVLMSYGPGAVMAVPAHDQRDFEFAKQYDLAIEQVIQPESEWDLSKGAFVEDGTLINSGKFDGLGSQEAIEKISDFVVKKKMGERKVNYRLRDWGISRQRYWGCPIPIINCPDCGPVAVPDKDLPVVLPENIKFEGAISPLQDMPEFVNTSCPQCGGNAKRETDTFDTFMESSWYYARFACKGSEKAMLDERANYWLPVNQYVGGIEHAVMHLLYSRFIHKIMRDEGLVKSNEPFKRLLTQGMVIKDGNKMSKSKGNVVEPKAIIDSFGADTARLFITFAAPPEQSLEWSDNGVQGAHRFLHKVWTFGFANQDAIKGENCSIKEGNPTDIDWDNANDAEREAQRDIYLKLQKATFDFDRYQFNTIVSAGMELLTVLSNIASNDKLSPNTKTHLIHKGYKILLQILSPIVPHITHQLWQELSYKDANGDKNILDVAWPKVNKSALKTNSVELIVQVNGKVRSKIKVASDADNKEVESLALADEKVANFVAGKEPKKVIVVPNKLINIVI